MQVNSRLEIFDSREVGKFAGSLLLGDNFTTFGTTLKEMLCSNDQTIGKINNLCDHVPC